ncbi:hypothetical protein RIR_jg18252.t1 [Rhizophagus irregularis DAOM 181602=DAOM 197198]|nr:hypothetical protein RIR_jg18252.t1 [Rhizophagus irregularis DAOM 181602=DAOM 197198]CAG8450780.1 17293_t:CDS:2 [Rhizophagus irregularis]
MTVDVGNTEMKKDELKLQSDHTVLKIELKDMMDDLRQEPGLQANARSSNYKDEAKLNECELIQLERSRPA